MKGSRVIVQQSFGYSIILKNRASERFFLDAETIQWIYWIVSVIIATSLLKFYYLPVTSDVNYIAVIRIIVVSYR